MVLLLPSRPLAGRVDRRSEAAARGVGGLRLLHIRGGGLSLALNLRRRPYPRPLPATRFARGGRGEERASLRRVLDDPMTMTAPPKSQPPVPTGARVVRRLTPYAEDREFLPAAVEIL